MNATTMDLQLMQGMTDTQRLLFHQHLNTSQKSPATAVVLCLFLGGVGAHRFYLGQVGLGLAYALFCWTLIPSFVALIELFLLSSRVRQYNSQKAIEAATLVRALN